MQQHSYGPTPWQFGELRLPEGAGPHPAAIIIHGGGWQDSTDLSYMRPIAADLTRRGFATWLVEYRRMGNPGGGYPATLEDLRQAADFLMKRAEGWGIDRRRVVALGHSSGGQMALWLAIQRQRELAGVVSLAGVLDMAAQWHLRNRIEGSNYVDRFLGGSPSAVPERYAAASPIELPAPQLPAILVHGEADWRVLPEQSQSYLHHMRAQGREAELILLPDVDHLQIYDPAQPGWERVVEAIWQMLRP